MPPHLKKSVIQTHLENSTYVQIVSHIERELQLTVLEAPDEMQINTVTQQATQQNSEKSKPTCHPYKSQVTIEISVVSSNEKRIKPEITQTVLIITTAVLRRILTSTTVKFPTLPTPTIRIIKETEDLDLSTHPVRPVVRLTTPH